MLEIFYFGVKLDKISLECPISTEVFRVEGKLENAHPQKQVGKWFYQYHMEYL